MTRSSIDTIIALIAQRCEANPAEFGPATEFEELDIDSLVMAELAVILGNEYGVGVTEEELSATTTIGQAAAVLDSKLVRR